MLQLYSLDMKNTFLISKSAVEGLVMYPMDYYWVTADMKMAE